MRKKHAFIFTGSGRNILRSCFFRTQLEKKAGNVGGAENTKNY